MNTIVTRIETLFAERGDTAYGIEPVTQRQHALQCALMAQEAKAKPTMVTAALLHDIGHILIDSDLPDNCAENLDDHHEVRAHGWLEKHFGLAVADPVRLHVAAKRYLCTVEKDYEAKLSPTSRKSYQDQGGPMSEVERSAFESEPYGEDAVTLRRWDDLAKDETLTTPPIEAYRRVLTSCLNS